MKNNLLKQYRIKMFFKSFKSVFKSFLNSKIGHLLMILKFDILFYKRRPTTYRFLIGIKPFHKNVTKARSESPIKSLKIRNVFL